MRENVLAQIGLRVDVAHLSQRVLDGVDASDLAVCRLKADARHDIYS